MPSPLNDIERKILDFMVQYLRDNTYQPSIREIGERFAIKSTKTVSEHLQALADKGFLERDPSRSRGVRILGVDLHPDTVSVPCYREMPDGRSVGRAETYLTVDRRLAGAKGAFFVVARSDELAGLGVQEGDYLLVEPGELEGLEDGAVAAIRAGGTATFQKVGRNGQGVTLTPVRPGGTPVVVGDGPRRPEVLGRVTALYRRMDGTVMPTSLTAH